MKTSTEEEFQLLKREAFKLEALIAHLLRGSAFGPEEAIASVVDAVEEVEKLLRWAAENEKYD